MAARCPEPATLLALDEARLDAAEAEAAASHLGACAECRARLAEHRSLVLALSELGAAEERSPAPGTWARLEERLARPEFADRMPLGMAAAWRGLSELGRPAVAASLAAGLVGLTAGTWLAIAAQRGPAGEALASEAYTGSSLVGTSPAGFADYLSTTDVPGAGDDAGLGAEVPDDTTAGEGS